MKITQLDVQGFRSLKNVRWKPGDLNVLIGPNGSGKSNLLRMLELISAAAQGQLSRFVQAEGGMGAMVWDGEAGEVLWRIQAVPTIPPPPHSLLYEVELMRFGSTSSYQVRQEALEYHRTYVAEQPENTKPRLLTRGPRNARVFDEQGNNGKDVAQAAISEEETLLPEVAGPLSENRWFTSVQDYLRRWSVYHDQHIRTDYDSPIRRPAVSRLEYRVSPDGQDLINVLHTLYSGDREFKREVNSAIRGAFGDEFEELVFAPDAGDQRVQLRVRWKTLKRDQSAADLSDGTLRFLFLLAVLASPNPAPLIAIDEPETGLHPSMLPLVADFAVDAAVRTQVILTTHSDQFLDAFRSTDTRPTTTVAQWHDGETTLTTLDEAELAYWLKDYTLGNLFRSGQLENMAS